MNATHPEEAVVSTRLSRKGPLIEETFTAFRNWDLTGTWESNILRLETQNPFGAGSVRWLSEITRTLSSRFRGAHIRPLIVLAQAECPLDIWKPCLLWHLARRDLFYYLFATEWLYPAYRSGVYALRTKDLVKFVEQITSGRLSKVRHLSEYGATRLARDLLMTASLFGLMEGSTNRAFTRRHLPPVSFLYIAQAIAEMEGCGRTLIESRDWRLFLLNPEDVERELHEHHQFQRVSFEAAGSLVNVRLGATSLDEYATTVARERSWDA